MNKPEQLSPEQLNPGDRVSIYGFRDQATGERTGNTIRRGGVFVRMAPCKREMYEIRFDKGYTEHWSRDNLVYALNGHMTPTSYCPHNLTPDAHVAELLKGRRHVKHD